MYLQLGDLAVLIGSMGTIMAAFMGILATVLIRVINTSEKAVSRRLDGHEEAMSRRFDGQDKQLADMSTRLVEVEKGQGRLSTDMAVVKTDLSYLKPRVERIDSDLRDIVKPGWDQMVGNLSDIADDLGEVKCELKRIVPIERVGAG